MIESMEIFLASKGGKRRSAREVKEVKVFLSYLLFIEWVSECLGKLSGYVYPQNCENQDRNVSLSYWGNRSSLCLLSLPLGVPRSLSSAVARAWCSYVIKQHWFEIRFLYFILEKKKILLKVMFNDFSCDKMSSLCQQFPSNVIAFKYTEKTEKQRTKHPGSCIPELRLCI